METFNYWEFVAGLGIFLLGMNQMETGLKNLAGHSFRNLLQKFTNKPWKGVLTGTFITAVLQSSSLVTLMVLAFLGAGLISLKNTLGVILGANLGTTFTAWIVATLGFKVSIASIALPFIGIGALIYIFFANRQTLKNIGILLLGFGFLFYGIELMKTSIEELANQVDLSQFSDVPTFFFFLAGIGLTALIQSSSATLVILLSALHSGFIGLDQAAAATVGSNIGTTITVIFGAFQGTPDKKRLASFHLLFNLTTGILILPFLHLILNFLQSLAFGKDPLIDLVIFNSFMNLAGILLFYPFLGIIRKWLKRRFVKEKEHLTVYIQNVETSIPEAALKALEKDLDLVYLRVKQFILQVSGNIQESPVQASIWKRVLGHPFEIIQEYNEIKVLEDELTAYHIKLQGESMSELEAKRLTSLMLSLRMMVYAAKAFKGIAQNLKDIEDAERNLPRNLYITIQSKIQDTLEKIDELKAQELKNEQIPDWVKLLESDSEKEIEVIYKEAKSHKTDIPFSTLSNVIKEYIRGLYNLGASVIHAKHPVQAVMDSSEHKA